jgi:hypothetical protein
MKLNLCCGSNILDGFDNHDSDLNISTPLPMPDNSVEFILIERGLEHVGPHEGFNFLREAYRVLSAGGVLRVCVPTLAKIEDREHAASLILGHGHQMVFSQGNLKAMLWAAGFDYSRMVVTGRWPMDGHWKVIGRDKDDLETLRLTATK